MAFKQFNLRAGSVPKVWVHVSCLVLRMHFPIETMVFMVTRSLGSPRSLLKPRVTGVPYCPNSTLDPNMLLWESTFGMVTRDSSSPASPTLTCRGGHRISPSSHRDRSCISSSRHTLWNYSSGFPFSSTSCPLTVKWCFCPQHIRAKQGIRLSPRMSCLQQLGKGVAWVPGRWLPLYTESGFGSW